MKPGKVVRSCLFLMMLTPGFAGCLTAEDAAFGVVEFEVAHHVGRTWPLGDTVFQPTEQYPLRIVATVENRRDLGDERDVCLSINGDDISCMRIGLAKGQQEQIQFQVVKMDVGPNRIRLLNQTFDVTVQEIPHLGEWVTGTALDLKLNPPGDEGYSLSIRFHNASAVMVRMGDYDSHAQKEEIGPFWCSHYATDWRGGSWDGETYTRSLSWQPLVGRRATAEIYSVEVHGDPPACEQQWEEGSGEHAPSPRQPDYTVTPTWEWHYLWILD